MKKIFLLFFLVFSFIFSNFADAKSRGGSFSSFKSSKSLISKPSISSRSNVSNTKSGSFGKAASSSFGYKTNKIDLSKYKKSGNPVTIFNSSSTKKYEPKNDYSYRYYTNPPSYVYQTYPSFGMWDTIFLMYLLDNNNEWFYHHQNDEGVQEFKKKLKEMSEENEELKEKYENLEKKFQEMENNNVKINEEYEPKDFEESEQPSKSIFEYIFE